MNKSIIKKINHSKVVSFDIYDTLIKRVVKKPSDVFQVVENIWNEKNIDKIYNFKMIRQNAEKICRNKNNRETTLNEIYNEIEKNIGEKAQQLKEIECEIELKSIYLNEDIKEIYNYCLKQQKKIIITSDMYLDKAIIEKILNKLKIKYDRLFVSSELGYKKSNGKMFKYIAKEMNIKFNELLHIGDNLKSDLLQPKLKGINVIYIKNNKDKNVFERFADKNLKKNENEYYRFGYEILGPLMFGFSRYIEKIFIENSMNEIVFLAREGSFIKKCYEKYTKNNFPCKYIFVSRKSISSSVIYGKNQSELKNIIDMQSVALNETVEMFLKRFNLLNIKNENYLKDNMINLNEPYCKHKEFIKLNFTNFLDTNLIGVNLFQEYLKEQKIDSKTLLVDIGWNGTMQDLIQNELNNHEINAVYLGVRKKRKTKFKYGYLFDGNNVDEEIYSRGMVAWLEILFSANHGTTIGYKKTNNIEPIIIENEIEKEQMKKILDIQSGAERFIVDVRNDKIFEHIVTNDEEFTNPIWKIGTNPEHSILRLFEDFKINNEKIKKLIGGEKSLFFYFLNLKMLKNDFFDSGWKIAFLKKVFKINISYKKIYKLIYCLKK